MPDPTTDIGLPPIASLPALVTPFDADESVDHDSLSAFVNWTIDRGVDGLVPCGTTGEFASLATEERRAVVETTVEAADGRVPVIAGAGATTVPDVQGFIEGAAAVGADAALVPPPYYHAANNPAGDRTFYERVADGSELPIYLYNIPSHTGGAIPVETVSTLASHEMIHGLKDTSGDFSAIQRFISKTPASFRILEGYDDHFVGAWAMGSDGGINALAGVFPGAVRTLCDSLAAGDLDQARGIQRHVLSPMFEVCLEHGFAAGAKIALQKRGIVDHSTVRPPIVELEGSARDEVVDTVEGALSYLE